MELSKRFFDGFGGGFGLLLRAEVVAKIMVPIVYLPVKIFGIANGEVAADCKIRLILFRTPSYFFNALFFGIPVQSFFFHQIEEFLLLFFGSETYFASIETTTTAIEE